MSPTATATRPLDGLEIHHDSEVRVLLGPVGDDDKLLYDVDLDGELVGCRLERDDADHYARDIERAITIEKVIHDAPIRHDSAVTTECTDPDPATHEVYVDGGLIGEWGHAAAHGVEVGLGERIKRAQLVHGIRQMADFLEQHPGAPVESVRAYVSYYGSDSRERLAEAAEQLGEYEPRIDDRGGVTLERCFGENVSVRAFGYGAAVGFKPQTLVYKLPDLPGRNLTAEPEALTA